MIIKVYKIKIIITPYKNKIAKILVPINLRPVLVIATGKNKIILKIIEIKNINSKE